MSRLRRSSLQAKRHHATGTGPATDTSFTEALLVVLKCTDGIIPFEEVWGKKGSQLLSLAWLVRDLRAYTFSLRGPPKPPSNRKPSKAPELQNLPVPLYLQLQKVGADAGEMMQGIGIAMKARASDLRANLKAGLGDQILRRAPEAADCCWFWVAVTGAADRAD